MDWVRCSSPYVSWTLFWWCLWAGRTYPPPHTCQSFYRIRTDLRTPENSTHSVRWCCIILNMMSKRSCGYHRRNTTGWWGREAKLLLTSPHLISSVQTNRNLLPGIRLNPFLSALRPFGVIVGKYDVMRTEVRAYVCWIYSWGLEYPDERCVSSSLLT